MPRPTIRRRVFAGAVPKHRWLGGYLDLQREVLDPRIQRVDPYTSRLFVNFFKVAELAELDDVLRVGWVCEAYQVGSGEHMKA